MRTPCDYYGTMYPESSSNSLISSNNEPLSPKSNFFSKIPGESIHSSIRCLEGKLFLTNYRLILHFTGDIYYIPLGLIEQTEVRKVPCLHISCKDARSYKCTFSSSEQCIDWQKRINDSIIIPLSIEKIFCHAFYYATRIEKPELHSLFTSHVDGSSYASQSEKIFDDEIKRLGFDLGGAWRISKANEEYKLCSSYPRRIIVPSCIPDSILEGAARFRSSRRIPTVVWRHSNGAVIARSSQPEVGWLWWRSSEDEDLVKAMAEASACDSPSSLLTSFPQMNNGLSLASEDGLNKHKSSSSSLALSDLTFLCDMPEGKSTEYKKLLIMDARSYATAVANRARGGGCECLEYYPTCEIQFMNLDNIHTIRKSQQALRNIVNLPPDIPNWFSLLESTRWLYHMSGLIRAAVIVAQTIAVEGRPVMVHCSDGWDRTPQIIALAEILLDPYYRTFEGFQVLVQREWIEFGHKFSDRCGCGISCEDLNERCPIFLQWVDCVYQVLIQYPTVFQFNQAYLVKLTQHVYSNLFSTFLFNSSRERDVWEQQSRSTLFSVWPLFTLNQYRYTNHLYAHTSQVLYPSFHAKDLVLWKAVYMTKVKSSQDEKSSVENVSQIDKVPSGSDLVKTKSCEDLQNISSLSSSQLTRTSSDPNLRGSSPDLEMLMSAIGSVELGQTTCSPSHANKAPLSEEKHLSKERELKLSPSNHSSDSSNGVSGAAESTSKHVGEKDTATLNRSERCLLKMKRGSQKITFECPSNGLGSANGAASSQEKLPFSSRTITAQEKVFNASLLSNLKTNKALLCRVKRGEEYPKKMTKHSPCKNVFPEERLLDENFSFAASSTISCSYCLKNKKGTPGDVPEAEVLRCLDDDVFAIPHPKTDGRRFKGHHPTQGHLMPSSSIISTPNEERYVTLHLDRPHFSDGLANYTDDTTQRLNQVVLQHQLEVDTLRKELLATKSFYHRLIHAKLSHSSNENHGEDQNSSAESVGSGSDNSVGHESSGLSDTSWEALEERDARTTLWVPDHAVDCCMGCHSQFWIGRRKHHCRNCGKVFCAECSENSVPIPKENLFTPVRVCGTCFSSLLEFRPNYVSVASN